MSEEIIRPMRKKCDCGEKVINHHWVCDDCWGKREKERYKRGLEKTSKEKKYMVNFITKYPDDFKSVMRIIQPIVEVHGRIILNEAGLRLLEKEGGRK